MSKCPTYLPNGISATKSPLQQMYVMIVIRGLYGIEQKLPLRLIALTALKSKGHS